MLSLLAFFLLVSRADFLLILGLKLPLSLSIILFMNKMVLRYRFGFLIYFFVILPPNGGVWLCFFRIS